MTGARPADEVPLPGGDFRLFLTRLAYQCMLACGVIENPLTRTKGVNPGGARMILDDVEMLAEKTEGNLSPDEAAHLSKVLGDLRQLVERAVPGGE